MAKKIIEIIWTEPAKKNLQDIYNFLAKLSEPVAFGIISKIIDRAETLKKGFTKSGQTEPLLRNRKYEYRYLVDGNYKIIYFESEGVIIISAVFDTRQNPGKLKKMGD